MSERMYRAQILLRPEQHRRLLQLSQEEGKSISEITRSLLDEALLSHQTTVWMARSRAIDQLRAMRRNVTRGGVSIEGDLVVESRSEREDDRPWR
jgi:adenylate kinase family enzyme